MPASNATSRFSGRVENYIRYRPGYPPEVLRTLKSECGLTAAHAIADIASGTGIWTRILLENGNPVFGVEPNAEMRGAGQRLLAGFPKSPALREPPKLRHLSIRPWISSPRRKQGIGSIARGRGGNSCAF
jgi:SAM-dependent methyltransferase